MSSLTPETGHSVEKPSLSRATNTAIPTLYGGIAKSLFSRYCGYAFQVVALMLLARIFTPQQYGVIASVQVFYVFFQMMADMGFGPAIVNLRSTSDRELGGIVSISILFSCILFVLFLSLSGPFQQFYSNPDIGRVVPFLAGGLFFYGCAIVPTALLNRDMMFFKVATATAIAEVISTLVAVILYFRVNPLTALASKSLTAGLVQCVSVYISSGRTEFGRPRPTLQFSGARKILWFSTYQMSFSFVNYFSRNLDNILVGRLFGASALGMYDKAYQLMKYPLQLLTFGMTPAIQPVLAKHAGEPAVCEEIHKTFIYKLSWLGLAAGFVIVVAAELIVRLVLGPKWHSVVPIIQQLGLSIPAQVVLSTGGSFYQALNRPDLLFKVGLNSAIVVVAATLIGIWQQDLVLMSWLLSVSFNVGFVICYSTLYKRVFMMSPWLFYKHLRAQIIVNVLFLCIGSPFVSGSIMPFFRGLGIPGMEGR